MKQAYKTIYLLFLLTCFISFKALAIDDDGGIGGDVPIDGGLSLLVAAGVGYGVKKVRNRTPKK
jgi:hypothetical protein